jgi:hypothetical protein
MDAMMVVIENQKTQLDALTSGMSSTPPPTPFETSNKPSLNEYDTEKAEVEGNEDPPKKDNPSRGHSPEIPHPTSYVSGRHLQMPHLASCSPPPPLDAYSFANWQDNTRSHINFMSIELWRIIEQGFNPTSKDLNNLLPWELITSNSMPPPCTSSTCHSPRWTRHLFDPSPPPRKLGMLSPTSLSETRANQESKFEEAHNEADNFVMLDGETLEELHRHLSALQVKLIDLGSTQCDGKWMKRKFLQALLPFMKDTMNSIKGGANYQKMTAHDILQEIVAKKISEKNVDDALARARGVHAPNLALKAKVSYNEEASLVEEEEVMSGTPMT